jgi:hypothetical protein
VGDSGPDIQVVIELDKSEADQFRAFTERHQLNAEVAEEEQFFGESLLALGLIYAVPATLDATARALAAFAMIRGKPLTVNGRTVDLQGRSEQQLAQHFIEIVRG